jgi:EmrB/QacA subfamily drug resistance transporter
MLRNGPEAEHDPGPATGVVLYAPRWEVLVTEPAQGWTIERPRLLPWNHGWALAAPTGAVEDLGIDRHGDGAFPPPATGLDTCRMSRRESARPASTPGRGRNLRPGLGLGVICAAAFLISVDGLAVAIALPTVQADLGIDPIAGQWTLTAYGLCFGGLLLLGGRLGDLYGRRRLLMVGLLLFAAGSLSAGVAPGPLALFVARAVQGLGAAAAVPATLSLIGSLYPPGAARSRALGVMAAMASLGVISGALFGGVVTTAVGWRWVFLAAAPLAAAAAALAPVAVPEARAENLPGGRPDVVGGLLVTTSMLLVLYGLSRVEHSGPLSVAALGPGGAGVGLLLAFVVWERRAAAPLVRLQILAVRSLRGAAMGIAANAAAFTSVVYVGTLYLQTALGYTPLQAGLALLPVDVVSALVGIGVGRALLSRSPRAVTAASLTLTCVGLLWLARAPVPARYVVELLPPLVLLGVSLTVAFVVLTHETVSEVGDDEKGLASGLFETANHLLGGAVAVALYATVATTVTNRAAVAGSSQSLAAGHGAAFAAAAVLAALGTLSATQLRSGAVVRSAARKEQQELRTD